MLNSRKFILFICGIKPESAEKSLSRGKLFQLLNVMLTNANRQTDCVENITTEAGGMLRENCRSVGARFCWVGGQCVAPYSGGTCNV